MSVERLGISEHFWDTTSVDGVDTRHTIPVVYRVVPAAGQSITLDSQHDDYCVVTAPPEGANEYVVEYFERFEIA